MTKPQEGFQILDCWEEYDDQEHKDKFTALNECLAQVTHQLTPQDLEDWNEYIEEFDGGGDESMYYGMSVDEILEDFYLFLENK